jgi:hypothetical protein
VLLVITGDRRGSRFAAGDRDFMAPQLVTASAARYESARASLSWPRRRVGRVESGGMSFRPSGPRKRGPNLRVRLRIPGPLVQYLERPRERANGRVRLPKFKLRAADPEQ